MSELRTNRIVPRDGLPSGASGGVIQVVTAINTVQRSNTSHSITNGQWQFTGTTATITPTRSDSKILITFDQSFFWQTNAGGNQGCGIRIYRGSTAITTNSGYSGHYIDTGNANNNRVHSYQHGQKLDSPATTSAVTYNLYGYFWTSDWTNLRYQYNDGNDDSPSTITLMEISG
tara:strand:+ start:1333 stop:1854 length:522 start_codon:yes stop_codon:yes gene_type:complete